ncbi:MAG TPA: carboxyltransferase domain-containing protein, partial [Chitinophagaceae bacterium]|nr:carboxyltransferase domain-containing protein [Chitinophagaceae bacterium]
LAGEKNISVEDIIRLHISRQYRVYMLGFLPGFAYMAEVEDSIAVPRKPQPQPILAGSVGIAGKQTGVYPLNSPGGWQIIGRTPLKMFEKDQATPCLLKAGDYVEFYSITKDEFEDHQSRSI